MMTATASIEALCENRHPPSELVVHLVTSASDLRVSLDLGASQQESIGALLDGGRRPIPAEAYARVAIQMQEVGATAVDRGRALLGDLLAAGLVR